MPFISFKTNVKVEPLEKFQESLLNCILEIPGKTVAVTMLEINDGRPMCYRGTNEPCAMVETLVNAGTDMSTTKAYADKVIDVVSTMLGIPFDRIYVTVSEADKWHLRRQ